MRYYILGTNKMEGAIKTKPMYIGNTLKDSLNEYTKYINEIRANRLLLIVDFEVTKKPNFGYINIEKDYQDHIPFLIVGEWKLGNEKDMCIRSDMITISERGFTRQFKDNLAALKYFFKFKGNEMSGNDHYWAYNNSSLNIVYKKKYSKNGKVYYKIYDRKITSLKEAFGQPSGPKIKKFYIPDLDWESMEITKNQRDIKDYFLEVKEA